MGAIVTGGIVGLVGGPFRAVVGGLGGGIIGGIAESYMNHRKPNDKSTEYFIKEVKRQDKGSAVRDRVPSPPTPVSVNLNIKSTA